MYEHEITWLGATAAMMPRDRQRLVRTAGLVRRGGASLLCGHAELGTGGTVRVLTTAAAERAWESLFRAEHSSGSIRDGTSGSGSPHLVSAP